MFTNEEIKKLTAILGLITLAIIIYHVVDNFSVTLDFLNMFMKVLSPILVGFAIAYVVNIPMKSVERVLFKKVNISPKLKRVSAFLITIIVGIVFFVIIFSFALPQLINSVEQLVDQLPQLFDNVSIFATKQFERFDIPENIVDQAKEIWENFLSTFLGFVSNIAAITLGVVTKFVSGFFSAILSTVMAIYILLSKESIGMTFKKFLYAFTPEKFNNPFMKYLKVMDDSFEHFIRGQLIEALVLGTICYIGMLIFRFDYPLLISVIVGLTNIIPLFGPYIGAVPSVLLLLMVNPVSALWFILYVSILQQIESNLIYPRVVGNSVGLSGFWIIVAVVIGNSLFGILGILVGIPLLSTFYTIIGEIAEKRLKNKRIRLD